MSNFRIINNISEPMDRALRIKAALFDQTIIIENYDSYSMYVENSPSDEPEDIILTVGKIDDTDWDGIIRFVLP